MQRRFAAAVGGVAGAFALASGLAYLAYLFPFEGRDAAITAWNLLIIPTALYLGGRMASRGPIVSAASAAAGLTASLLWAFAYHSPAVEPWWIGLAAAWWLGLGWLLRTERRALGRFTLLLGVAAAIDFVLTGLHAPMPIYALGGFKIPLTIAWTIWVGLTLVRDPRWGTQRDRDASLTRWSGATALIGATRASLLFRSLPQQALLLALVAAIGGCAAEPVSTLPGRPQAPADWTTVTTSSGDLELTVPPYVDAWHAEESVIANSTPDANSGRLTFSLMAFGPWSVLEPPQPGETSEQWIERVILSGVPQERRSATASRAVRLPSGHGQLIGTTVDAGTPDEERVMVYAIPTHGRIGYLMVNGTPEEVAAHRADIELIAALMRFTRGGPPAAPPAGG